MADADLLELTKQGDVRAFAVLYKRHAGSVLRYCWSKAGDQHTGEDLAQDVFVVAWSKRKSAIIVDQSFLPWLLTISRNLCLNDRRKSARRRHLPLHESESERDSGSADDSVWIRTELGKLSPTDQELCRLCLVEGASYREAAIALGTTEAAVGKRLQRLRTRLRATFGNDSEKTS
ncbi:MULTISPECIES: RNA polymerase sigma factor [unclassified Frondihabitans]|uniref:RNA polymerase sigma factor n=1 Tax=unclassified Frondihabitans TaxID=2626248 RepID=UPI001315831D|nr:MULTISPECIES: RNA polymerase sigma factor [unclassified Frondihabitans]